MYRINRVAVLGSGIMGSGIACHLANAGLEVILLDILTPGLSENELSKPALRNKLVNDSLQKALKSKPSPIYHADFATRISTGNFEDDLAKIQTCHWIIEVVVERLDIKQQLFEKIELYRTPGALISSNTSGIPIHLMTKGRSEDFKQHFLGTHFFNPPRYLALLEIIPSAFTLPEVTEFFMRFGRNILGKQTVLCKDTPAFIGNRVGVYAMAKIFTLTAELGLSIEEVDALTGPAIGRPSTGTFRLADLVGLDTAIKVIQGISQNCPQDEQLGGAQIPDFLHFLVDQKFLGNKTNKGFYEKTDQKDDQGRSVIMGLDLATKTYRPGSKPKLPSLGIAKQIDDLSRRVNAMANAEDNGGQLIRRSLGGLFAYVSQRVPEISDQLYNIDQAMKAGYAWDLGPFEYWDIVGLTTGIAWAEAEGLTVADWVKQMADQGLNTFYRLDQGRNFYYDRIKMDYAAIPGTEQVIILERSRKPVYKNEEAFIHDLGDGVLCLEFTSKANAIGEGILQGLNEGIRLAEEGQWAGLVIGNQAKNFSVGANLMLIGMMAFQQEFDQLNLAVKYFQDTMMRCRYSKIPVVMATQGYTFGGGCEMLMHCDAAICAAESYIGLVEAGVGLIPGGGGSKEFALRIGDSFFEGDVKIPTLLEKFKTVALASVATSAHEAFDLGYLQTHRDKVILDTAANIAAAKAEVLCLAPGYIQPASRQNIQVLGRSGLAPLLIGAHSLKLGQYASEHDIKIAQKLAYVLCGGDLSSPQMVSEQYLLDIEREAFLSLCGEPKTLERIQYMLENNKPLRN